MEATNDWYEGIEKEISSLKDKITKKDYKLYELDLLLRVAKRVVGFSSDCEYCHGHRNDISNLVTDLRNLPEITKEEVANYSRTFRSILKHLEKHHGLHRSVPSLVIPLAIVAIGGLISLIMVPFVLSAEDMAEFGSVGVGLFIGIILLGVGVVVGVVLGIFRLFRKPI